MQALQAELTEKDELKMDVRWCAPPARLRAGERRDPEELRGPRPGALPRSFSTKLHLACERHDYVLSAAVTAGQASDLDGVEPVMEGIRVKGRRGPPRRRPRVLVSDKSYSYGPVRRWASRHHIRAVLPKREDQPHFNKRSRGHFDKRLYRERHRVECAVGLLKACRAIGTRYDKLAVNYQAMVQVALIHIYLRHLHPSDRAWRPWRTT